MTSFERLAGRGLLADRSVLVWSLAEGRRGRRWRAVTTSSGPMTQVLLLEVDLGGRPARLELTTAAGALTLHPDASGAALHGNVVTGDGVRHLTFTWGPDHELEIDGQPIASAVTAHRLAGSTPVGQATSARSVAIGPDLAIREGIRRFTRTSTADWSIDGDGETRTLAVDERGIPIGLVGAEEWPLELD
jgi:hypothetical protein